MYASSPAATRGASSRPSVRPSARTRLKFEFFNKRAVAAHSNARVPFATPRRYVRARESPSREPDVMPPQTTTSSAVEALRAATTEATLERAKKSLTSANVNIRTRGLRSLVVACVAGACDAKTTAKTPEVLALVLALAVRGKDEEDEEGDEDYDDDDYEPVETLTHAGASSDGRSLAATCASWSAATFLTWLCEREPTARVWLKELGAEEKLRGKRDDRRARRLLSTLANVSGIDFDEEREVREATDTSAIGRYDAEREMMARKVREESQRTASTSRAAGGSTRRVSFATGARMCVSAEGDGGYELPFVAVSESDAQYLYALNKVLDTCGHHALAQGGLRELRKALTDAPIEAATQHASRALERTCELLSASDPVLSSEETRREALCVIRQCTVALHREVVDLRRQSLLTSRAPESKRPASPNSPFVENFPPDASGHGYGGSRGSNTSVLPIAHTLMLHVIPAVSEPALRSLAICTARLLLPLLQIAPAAAGEHPHGGALMRLGQYLDLWESVLESMEFEPGAASEYLTCVQVSAEIATVAGGAPPRGVGAAHPNLVRRWFDICLDEVIAAANPLVRQYCATALRQIHTTLPMELLLVQEADRCLQLASHATATSATPAEFSQLVINAVPALSLLGAIADVVPFASRMTATLLTLSSRCGTQDDAQLVVTALLSMLTHQIEGVRVSTYATLAAAGGSQAYARAVMEHPAIIGEIIVGGLNHEATAHNAAMCLEHLCVDSPNSRATAFQLSLYSAWLDALIGDQIVGRVASRAQDFIANQQIGGRLFNMSPSLRGLFHQSEKVRVRSATDLAHSIGHGLASAAEILLKCSDDPFDVVLLTDDEYVRDERGEERKNAFRESLRTQTFDDVRASLRTFIHDDAKSSRDKLIAELEIVMSDERLAAVLADPAMLDALLKLAVDSATHVAVVAGALRVLASACGASSLVRDLLTKEDGHGGRVTRLFGLVFHPQRRIREAMASLLSQVLFAPVTEAIVVRASQSKPNELSLPKVFLETYRFPRFVPEIFNPPGLGDSDPLQTEGIDVNRVLYMFARRQRLMHTYDVRGNQEAALLSFALGEENEMEDGDVRVMRDASRISCAPVVVGDLVNALGEARSHEQAARIVDGLKTNVQASRWHAMAVLASLGRWDESSERFLRRPPRSARDSWLWVEIADTLTCCLESFMRVQDSTLPPESLDALIQIAYDVVIPLASAGASYSVDARDDTCRDPPVLRHPIAAGSALGEDGGLLHAARSSALRASMDLLANVCEATRRYRLYAPLDVDADALVARLVQVDCVGVVTESVIAAKNCDYAARCAAVDASVAMLRLGAAPAESVFEFTSSLLDEVCPSYTAQDHRGSALMQKATQGLLFIVESLPKEQWIDAFYERSSLSWLSDLLQDSSSRMRARAYDILAVAVGPNSPIVDIIADEFPDLFDDAAFCALDEGEAAIARSSACKCIGSLMAGSAAAETSLEVPDDGFHPDAHSSVPFPSIPMLAAKTVWRDLARILMEDVRGDAERVGALHRGVTAALLAAARVDAHGIAEAFDFNPKHEGDGNMWHGAVGVLRRVTFEGYGSSDSCAAASNVAALLGVMTVAGVQSFDAKLAASALRDCLQRATGFLGGSNTTAARVASRCSESLATILQANARGDEDVIATDGFASTCAKVLASAVHGASLAENVQSATGACLLVTTLFRSHATSERAKNGSFEHVGASLLQSLLVLWHLRLLGNSAQREMVPTMSIIIAATRNVLAYDLSAKAASCEWGLVGSLIQTVFNAVEKSRNSDGSFKTVPTAMDVYVAASAMRVKRKDALAAALEFGRDADGKEIPSTVALSALTCLRHLMYSPPSERDDSWQEEIVNEAKECAMEADLSAMFRAVWPFAKLDQQIMYELLSLVVNFVANDPESKRALTVTPPASVDGETPKSFAQRLMDYAFDKHVPGSSTQALALTAVASLASMEGPARYWLVRSQFVEETAMMLAFALTKARDVEEDESKDAIRERWMRTVTACVKALASVACFDDGQKIVLRSQGGGEHILELCLEVIGAAASQSDVDAKRHAFMLMHNLAFHAGAKSHYSAHEVALDCLTQGVSDADPACAAAACAALFALTRNGQRIVALLRERGRDRALRGASKSTPRAHGDDPRLRQWSRCLRGLLAVLSASENDEAYANV